MLRNDRFRGCLLGQCLGDAAGFVVEGYPPEMCRDYVERILRTQAAGSLGRGGFPFGQYTDDSQLARELLQSWVGQGGFDAADYAKRIAAIFAQARIVGRGRATTHAAARLSAGVPWEQAGEPAPSAGNGSAMRAAPVGLMCADDPERLVEVACAQSRITHQDPRCQAGSVAIAGGTALALSAAPGMLSPSAVLTTLSDWMRPVHAGFAEGVDALEGWLALAPEEAVEPIAKWGVAADYSDGWKGISPFVVGSVLWSLYAFLRTPEDYWETLCTAIAVGGDVDTTAAMACAMSGAYLGEGALPEALEVQLNDQGTWGYEALVALADQAGSMCV